MTRVQIIEPVILMADAETEEEARSLIDAFIVEHGWYEDAKIYVATGQVDLSAA